MPEQSILVAAAVSIAIFIAAFYLLPGLLPDRSGARKKKILDRIHTESEAAAGRSLEDAQTSTLRDNMEPIYQLLRRIPGVENTYSLLVKAGLQHGFGKYLLGVLVLTGALMFVFNLFFEAGTGSIIVDIPLAIMLSRKYLHRRIEKRNDMFIDRFPDAVDMIVRSVRSGHPLNAALRMIAENTEPPISTEFRQVVDEIAYGRSQTEALIRLSNRIDQPDVSFFVVILGVQQETGGNLAEVLSNLSNILRKRKQMRLKIRALTSEGRMTAYILGSLPPLLVAVLHLVSPGYLIPLFHTLPGKFILGIAISMVLLAVWIVGKMIKIDI
ncbi:MAG: type II secretion system F family protein [Alphaproteobacteria bacterium]|nr:type II secretion system F family protein [Alphaproteobacteria bacterium]